ncbi:acyltransferase family protein [Naasia sp.]|uniref:acyltransferase family protein n=1 Tax=Naasia sp. TaxID=2546198 RepID=UPI0026247478|nr:acyltransferase family protein [Naasia sp.]
MTRTLAASPRRAEAATPNGGFLVEIQALRAIAVLLVVLYHLWPAYLRGGYVGVDVFFVISGYLISAHVIRSLERGRFTLSDFYARRIRRLLPASLTVLLAAGIATLVWAPQLHWIDTGKNIVASAFYVENWSLLFNAVDYLGASADVIPSQHFWSLSVEEQFYLVWPVFLLLGCTLAARRGWPVRRVLAVLVGIVVVVSLAYSAVSTAVDQASAYFNTGTRVWEFGAGTLLAIWLAKAPKVGAWGVPVTWLGLAAILAAALTYTDASAFPGYLALVPVLGTAMVIAGRGRRGPASPAPLFALRPVQFLGDISYSVYLWHWPLIVLLPLGLGLPLSNPLKALILVVTLVLAWASKRFIEDPFRIDRPGTADKPKKAVSRRRIFTLAAAGMVLVSVVGGAGWAVSSAKASQAQAVLDALPDPLTVPCFGAAALADPVKCAQQGTGAIYPDPIVAALDTGDRRDPPCQQSSSGTEVIVCSFGSKDPAAPRYALVGDSHAAQWMSAMRVLALRNGWHLDTYLRSGCGLSTIPAGGLGVVSRCVEWNDQALQQLVDGHYDVVVVSMRSSIVGGAAKTDADLARNVSEIDTSWRAVQSSGARIVAIRDTPQPVSAGIPDAPRCVAGTPDYLIACSFTRAKGLVPDPEVEAARVNGNVAVLDLTDRFCSRDTCAPVIGDVLVYRDGHHVSALYITTLAPFLDEALADALAG